MSSSSPETSLTALNVVQAVVGPVFVSTSYAASRVERLRRPGLDCDLGHYAEILHQYEVSRAAFFLGVSN